MNTLEKMPKRKTDIDLLVLVFDSRLKSKAFLLAQEIRDRCSLCVQVAYSEASQKSQMKKADKSGAEVALILDEMAYEENKYCLRYLRAHKEQQRLDKDELLATLQKK